MNLYDRSFWTFVQATGRVPIVPDDLRIAATGTPMALKGLTRVITSPGNDVIDPSMITRKEEANQLRRAMPVIHMADLHGSIMNSDAMSIPNRSIIPAQQAIDSQLGGGDGIR